MHQHVASFETSMHIAQVDVYSPQVDMYSPQVTHRNKLLLIFTNDQQFITCNLHLIFESWGNPSAGIWAHSDYRVSKMWLNLVNHLEFSQCVHSTRWSVLYTSGVHIDMWTFTLHWIVNCTRQHVQCTIIYICTSNVALNLDTFLACFFLCKW